MMVASPSVEAGRGDGVGMGNGVSAVCDGGSVE